MKTSQVGLSVSIVLIAGVLAVLPSIAQEASAPPTTGPATVVVAAGAAYATSHAGQGWLLGEAYRDLWSTPIEVEVLDVDAVGGGLTPVARVGGLQTPGLALSGADGRSYTFRSVNKSLSEVLPEEFRGSGLETVAQDQVSSSLPGAALLVAHLDAAAGVLSPEMKLVVMPDAARLGEHQEEFAGILGLFYEFPAAGFHGASEVLSGSDFIDAWRDGAQADSHALLRARLIDLLVGDWDRHHRQWRWARIPGRERWQPIPEDRDQALSSYDGLALAIGRFAGAQMVTFEPEYPSLDRLTINAADFDRVFLTNLERSDWEEAASAVTTALTNEVIATAVTHLPDEYVELRGDELEASLRSRRDDLEHLALRYYEDLAHRVDVWASLHADHVLIRQLPSGDLQVAVGASVAGEVKGEPHFERRFVDAETEEVRIYLDAGDDRVVVDGAFTGGIRVRIIGGPGDNRIDETTKGSVSYYADPDGDHHIGSEDPLEVSSAYAPLVQAGDALRIPGSPHRDWGRTIKPLVVFGYHFDPGTILGGGIEIETYGFGKIPWAARHRIQGAFAIDAAQPFVEYAADLRRQGGGPHFRLLAHYSGLDHIRYYGLGNETSIGRPALFYTISNQQVTLFGAVAFGETDNPSLAIGPVLRYSDSSGTDPETLLAQEQPYGYDEFGQVGLMATFDYDSRNPRDVLAAGLEVNLAGSYYPELWDAETQFGSIEGRIAGHFALGRRGLFSLFGAGKWALGEYPYFDAAYLGGETFSALHWNRYAGDGLARAGAEIKWVLRRLQITVPGEIGILASADVGRVFVDGEESSVWHPVSSLAVFYAPFDRLMLLELGVGWSRENTVFLMQGNLTSLIR